MAGPVINRADVRARSVEAGDGFGDLRSDTGNLHDRRSQVSHKKRVLEELTLGHMAAHDLPATDKHNDRAHHARPLAGPRLIDLQADLY